MHIVAPSNIIWPVTTICAWRRIPIYVSHHVEMKYYVYEYIKKVRFLAHVGWFLYKLFQLWPATYLAQLNAAPTLCFLNDHLPNVKGQLRRRIPSGVAHERFLVDSPEQVHGERRALLTKCGLAADADVCLFLMVQRLAPEKGTIRCLEALATVARTPGKPLSLDGKRPVHVVIAGDGPSRGLLEKFARDKDLPVTFTGNLPNTQLPPLYRAADVFVTCSTSETFGLTVLEALACGTPAVLPHCSVFDELWVGRVPDEWIYDEGDTGSITAALRSASAPAGKKRLQTHPIKASWQDCTQELLGQYREMIAHNLNHRQALATVIRALDHFLRAVFLSLGAWWCMRAYTTKLLKVGMHIFDDLMDL